MSLFLGSRSGSGREPNLGSGYSRDGRYSPPTDYTRSRHSGLTSSTGDYTGSRYSRDGVMSPAGEYSGSRYTREAITSPTPYRRSQSYTASYRYLPQYTSRYSDHSPEDRTSTHTKHQPNKDDSRSSNLAPRLQESKSRSSVTVLNEGTIVIKRPSAAVDTSDEEDDEEPEEEKEKTPSPPPRDPLEVEEEELISKLQTAGFLMSLPEEDQAKRRLVEIRQMRENPELFKPENSRDWKFTMVFSELVKPSSARAEEEKILILRLGSRGISDVEQTDVQVRLQEIWRDRTEEVERGVSRLEEEYEHLLTESSTEISELEGSIRGKQATILKLQEELLILSIRKDKVAQDMEKVTSAHQTKLEELKTEISGLEKRSSEYSVVIRKKDGESSLPEDERSEIESELECPVCLEISRPPIYQCGEGHIICSSCKPLLKTCCMCESKYSDPPIRCRFAEKLAAKYFREDGD